MSIPLIRCGQKALDLSRPAIMGVVNVTPDSFADGGILYSKSKLDLSKTLVAIEKMISDGADIIDIGGESTRPGATEITAEEELDRVIPVLDAVNQRFDVLVSVDTSTASVIQEAANNGAGLLNDVRALTREGALEAAAATNLPICLMHMQNQPRNMQDQPVYTDVVKDVLQFLYDRKQCCIDVGIKPSQIILDPGFGFGKTLDHNLTLFKAIDKFAKTGHAILVGVSRKTMIGQILKVRDTNLRVIGSVAMALMAAQKGAAILRVHDVLETKQAIDVWQSTLKNRE